MPLNAVDQKRRRKNLQDLNRMYFEAENADRVVFAEQRSNVLLVMGDHYNSRHSRLFNRIRTSRGLEQDQKLRLTKNHIQRIAKIYRNNITSHSPNVRIVPRNEKELQDQKTAELNQSVWEYAQDESQLDFERLRDNLAKNFVETGECAVKVFWDPNQGDFLGFKPITQVNPLTGEEEQVFDENGEPEFDPNQPIFSGKLVAEDIFSTNLLRPAGCTDIQTAEWLGVRKMVDVEVAKALAPTPEIAAKIEAEGKDEFMVFDTSADRGFVKTSQQTIWREFYFRPSPIHPRGYFYIGTKDAIFFEGELPFGVFPIIYEGFDRLPTSPRHRSIIKQIRPYQIELNRTASKIAETQVTSDDKVFVQAGTSLSPGGHLPGIRVSSYSGTPPVVVPGNSGAQYLDYYQQQLSEMYEVANVSLDSQDKKVKKDADPYAMLFRSVKDKKEFSLYTDAFQRMIRRLASTYLKLGKQYFDENMLIPAIGRGEFINIAEFKNSADIKTKIKVEATTDDLTTIFGKQMSINHALQFVGNQLEREDVGKLLRAMPFGNFEESFDDITIDYDTATNLILAIERGEQPQPSTSDNHPYIIKRLTLRTRQSDFTLLDPQIQQLFQQYIQTYQQLQVQREQEIVLAQSQFIPSGGAMVKVDYYVPKADDPSKSTRAVIPAEAVDWLLRKLAQQGSSQEQIQKFGPEVEQTIAQGLLSGQGQASLALNNPQGLGQALSGVA